MKLPFKLTLLAVAAGLGTAPLTLAEEPAPETTTETTVTEDPAPETTDEEKPTVDEGTTGEETTVGDDESVTGDDGVVPLDWVKRDADGEDPNVIFYNMAGGGDQPSGPATSPIAKGDAGKDEASAAIETKPVAPVTPVVREKKGPVALVKGARVFLRH